ncbi:MAG: TIGR00299 family protein, partial [Armatimonadota bacterium]
CRFDTQPSMTIERTGVGGGQREMPVANIVRVTLGASVEAVTYANLEPIGIVEATIDDMNPQWYEYLDERLRAAGALDLFLQSVGMKKGRIGTLLTALCLPDRMQDVAFELLTHSTTIGTRFRTEMRYVLPRRERTVMTEFGEIRLKEVALPSGGTRSMPEFSSLCSAARTHGIPLREVESAVRRALGEA